MLSIRFSSWNYSFPQLKSTLHDYDLLDFDNLVWQSHHVHDMHGHQTEFWEPSVHKLHKIPTMKYISVKIPDL